MIEILIVLIKVLVVLCAFGGLMYLASRYIPWPAPASPWAQCIIGLVLLVIALIVMMSWAFHVSLGALGALEGWGGLGMLA